MAHAFTFSIVTCPNFIITWEKNVKLPIETNYLLLGFPLSNYPKFAEFISFTRLD